MTNIIDFTSEKSKLASKSVKPPETGDDYDLASLMSTADEAIIYMDVQGNYPLDITCMNTVFKVNRDITAENVALRMTLMREEFEETYKALEGALHDIKNTGSIADETYIEILDGLVDQTVINLGTADILNMDFDGAWDEILQSNLSKVDTETGRIEYREDGKVLKGANYKAPDLTEYINFLQDLE